MIKLIQTDEAPKAIGPYSQAVVVGDLMFTSGQIPLDLDGNVVVGDIKVQTEQVFKNLDGILRAAGATFSDVIKATVFINDMNEFPLINEVYALFFENHRPARSTVEVSRLPKDVKIEIELLVKLQK